MSIKEIPMLLETPWDRGNRRSRRPPWLASEVESALAGYEVTKRELRHEKRSDGIHHPYNDLVFDCECVVIGDLGWEPCAHAFHRFLASVARDSDIGDAYFRMRAVFDAALEEAWKRHPMSQEEESAIRDMLLRTPIQFRTERDLMRTSIWVKNGLRAALNPAPLRCLLTLSEQYVAGRPALAFELLRDVGAEGPGVIEMPAPLDVSSYSAAEVIACIP